MPFDWSPDYIDLVAVVHEEIRVPKSYEPYSIENDFIGYVDGVQVDNRALLVDPLFIRDRKYNSFFGYW